MLSPYANSRRFKISKNSDNHSDVMSQGQDAGELDEGKIRKSSRERRLKPTMHELKEQV